MELVTIIIPIYKVEKYLDRCVDSVVKQTYKNLEIILVDDGSPDNCPMICDEWVKKDDRIKVIHKQNGGLSDARNAGIEVATGDYLMFLDSDDYVDVNICQRLLDLININKAEVSMCGFIPFYEDEELPKIKKISGNVIVFNRQDIIDQIYKPTIDMFMVAWAKLYKRSIFNEIRYPIGKLHEDEFVIHEILNNVNVFVYTGEQMYFYMQRRTSITGVKKQKNITDVLDAFKSRYEFLNKNFPQNKNKNNLWYIGVLRGVYISKFWATKQIKIELIKQYKEIYRKTKHKDIKARLFYFAPHIFTFLQRKIKRIK